ncbi:MAG TPA: M24 family metallopeptidase [Solirubrobacteraceae bacterium]
MNVLIYGASSSCLELRHEIPLAIMDPFLYLEAGERRAVLTNSLEELRIAAVAPDLELILGEELGRHELIAQGHPRWWVRHELCVRAASALGIREAMVPPDFPLALAERLRAAGVAVAPDETLFVERRRHKSEAELAGIRRASEVAVAAMGEAARTLREASIDGDRLLEQGETLTVEILRARVRELSARAGAPIGADMIVRAMTANAAIGHDPGAGPLPPHTAIEIDLWPCDETSGCWSDMKRTFVRGEISEAIAALHRLVLETHEQVCAAVAPGMAAIDLYDMACEPFERAGHPTLRTEAPGETLRSGFYFCLGHGVGLDVHEPPLLCVGSTDTLVAGDVIAVEPGLIVPGVGGAGVEDLLLLTDAGCERLTGEFSYDLTP